MTHFLFLFFFFSLRAFELLSEEIVLETNKQLTVISDGSFYRLKKRVCMCKGRDKDVPRCCERPRWSMKVRNEEVRPLVEHFTDQMSEGQ